MFGFKGAQVKTIMSISRKLHFNKAKLDALTQGQKNGVPEDQLIAELLGIPEGEDAKAFLSTKLTDKELEVLRDVVDKYTDGKGKNPLD